MTLLETLTSNDSNTKGIGMHSFRHNVRKEPVLWMVIVSAIILLWAVYFWRVFATDVAVRDSRLEIGQTFSEGWFARSLGNSPGKEIATTIKSNFNAVVDKGKLAVSALQADKEGAVKSVISSGIASVVEKFEGVTGKSHTVKSGDTLWGIAGSNTKTPWEWRSLMVKNRQKISSAIYYPASKQWKVNLKPNQKISVNRLHEPFGGIPKEPRYAVQFSAVAQPGESKVHEVVQKLVQSGLFAYSYKIRHQGTWRYRIRVGFFETADAARQAAKRVIQKHRGLPLINNRYWLTSVGSSELKGGLLDYGVQRINPWVIELGKYRSRKSALQSFNKASRQYGFPYIVESKSGGKTRYSARVGYYHSRAEALSHWSQEYKSWKTAKAIRLSRFQELLPGQNIALK